MNRGAASRAAVVVAGLGLLAGCGESPGYDDTAIESYLASSQHDTFGPAAEVGKASCPGALELREAMTFTCKLEVSGTRVPYRVRLTHVHDTKMSITAAPDGVIVSTSKLRDFVGSTLPKGASGAVVDCGGEFVVAKVGDTLPCTLTLGSQEQPIKVTLKDETGRLSIGS